MWRSTGFVIVVLLSCGVAFAQPPGNICIRTGNIEVTGGYVKGDTVLFEGSQTLSFPLVYVNRDTCQYNLCNAFIIYSASSKLGPRASGTATWAFPAPNGGSVKFTIAPASTMPGIWVDTTGFLHAADFGGLFKFNLFGADGTGADTVAFAGAANDHSQTAMHAKDSGVFFIAKVQVHAADTGKWICLDSATYFPNWNPWKWNSFGFNCWMGETAFPSWGGARCYVLANCCRGLTGNVDCDPDDRCDVSDISALIDHLYLTFAPLCCKSMANIDGSPDGNSDISDLTALIDYLYISFTPPAPCP